ncbi:MAG: hypothetical protein K0R75_412 [Paenibacillaceae bacterium]|nr:hypothetical protein [Paenibacillaceae bacterium]
MTKQPYGAKGDGVTDGMIGFGGNAMASAGTANILVENCEDFILANVMFQQRPKGAGSLTDFSGIAVDPGTDFVIQELADSVDMSTPGYEQVVMYKRGKP